jgi:hypothetical protein
MNHNSLRLNTSDGPRSESVVLAVLLVLLTSVLFATFLAGPAPSWDDAGEDEANEPEGFT